MAKRMGTALRKLSTQTKKNGVTLGGREEGKLKHGVITKLSAYYGKAIRAHPNNVTDMQDGVLATFYHVSSTDGRPQHDLCPEGKESWCFFQRTLAEGREPGDHRSNISTPLSPPVAAQVKEVYERLGHKTGFVRLHRVLFATCCAVGEFNSGTLATIEELYGAMGLASDSSLRLRKRLRQSIHQEVARTKEARGAHKLYAVDASTSSADYAPEAF